MIDDLPVPRTRGGFRTQLFDRYQHRMHDVDITSLRQNWHAYIPRGEATTSVLGRGVLRRSV